MSKFISTPAPNADQFYPYNDPPIGTPLPVAAYPENATIPKLFQPITLRGTTFKNRIWVSPMCMYSSDNGHATDFHLVHIGGFATRGVGAICIEATAVLPEGRISPEDAGLWTDTQIAPLKRIVNFCHAQGTLVGIQLAHAGRKASTFSPWVHLNSAKTIRADRWVAKEDENGWPNDVIAPSKIAFADDYPVPREMTEQDLKRVEEGFVTAVERVKEAGFDFIELHAAHGYLLHEFLSPLSNTRNDAHGGQPLANRFRYPLKIVDRVRKAWDDKPLFVRISASDWAEGDEKGEDGTWRYWGIEQTKLFVEELRVRGVDLVDVSSGGNWVDQKIPIGPGYQTPFAAAIKRSGSTMPLGTVGLITSPTQAESILEKNDADVVFLARELLRNPHWPLWAAQELGVAVKSANQYERAWIGLLQKVQLRPN